MKKIILLSVIFLVSSNMLFPQEFPAGNGAEMCSHRKSQNMQLIEKSFRITNAPKHTFDVLNYTININLVNCLISPYPNSFTADVKILIRIDSTLNQIVLDADNASLSIDSMRINAVSYTHSGNNLTIQLDRSYSQGEQAEVQIFYKHADIADGAFYASGGFVFTDCEPEGARKWFPCYDKPDDKATTDISAKVPSNARLGSNGLLKDSLIDGNTIRYHWVSRDPVSTYLIVLTARNNYQLDIVNWTNPNTSEVIPMRFYYNTGENPTYIKSIIGNMTTFYSTEFGDHPFEKNGFATLNNEFAWGGMENQSLTSLCSNCWSESLIAHEYAHQWFGDMITCATWADIFLNEGFATWAEAYWFENKYGYAAYKNEMLANANSYFSGNPHWAISSPSWGVTTPTVNTLFNYAITYMKGSCVMHMLRYTLGDSIFFPALKAYATDAINYKYKNATIEDFKNKMETDSGKDLGWFFDQWIYKPDHPVYRNEYLINQGTNGKWSVLFTAKQEEQPFLPYFQMPVELKTSFKDGTDTLIRVFNSFNQQSFAFEFDKEPILVNFDPNNEILLKKGSTIVGLEETPKRESGFSLKAVPNPVTDNSRIIFNLNKPALVTVELYNNSGTKINTILEKYLSAGEHSVNFNRKGFKAGIYFVVLRSASQTETLKIIKAL
jgi:aminopeptidase N